MAALLPTRLRRVPPPALPSSSACRRGEQHPQRHDGNTAAVPGRQQQRGRGRRGRRARGARHAAALRPLPMRPPPPPPPLPGSISTTRGASRRRGPPVPCTPPPTTQSFLASPFHACVPRSRSPHPLLPGPPRLPGDLPLGLPCCCSPALHAIITLSCPPAKPAVCVSPCSAVEQQSACWSLCCMSPFLPATTRKALCPPARNKL